MHTDDKLSYINKLRKRFGFQERIRVDWRGDGMGLTEKNTGFLDDPKFAAAWTQSRSLNMEAWHGRVPDIRWRAHVCCWAASQAMHIPGDFVECGVHGGLLSITVANYVDFASTDRNFWLFDTFSGVPVDQVDEADRAQAERLNSHHHGADIYEIAKRNFASFPNAHLVRGMLPGTLADATIDKVAYLSMDLNNAVAEHLVIEQLWPKLSPGAFVILDDYAFVGYESQYTMWNEFARAQGVEIMTLPTGQGLLAKPATF